MAAIDGYLSLIKTAIYGEEVRESIYQSISAINNECNTIMSSAQNTMDDYKNNIELYAYVDELPSVGDEQKIYLVQDNLEYVNEWSDDYDISIYGGAPLTEFPAYLALEPQSEQDEAPSFLSSDNFKPSLSATNLGHDFAVIVHISEYDDRSATVSDPEWAMLVVDINVSSELEGSTHNLIASARAVMHDSDMTDTATDCSVAIINGDSLVIPWYLYNGVSLPRLSTNTDISSPYSSVSMRYLHVNVKEYIYDSSTEKWIYNHSHILNDIYIGELTSASGLTIANTSGDGLVSGLKLSNTNKTRYGWFAGILRTATPLDSYVATVIGGSPSEVSYNLLRTVRYSSVYTGYKEAGAYNNMVRLSYFDPENYDIYNDYSIPSLKHPLQVINDVTYSGQMYVWNNQLQHYIAMKSEETFTVDCDYNDSSGEYDYHLSKTYEEIDAYFRPNGTINWHSEVKGCFTHPGPGRFGNLINWYFSSGFYYFKYEGTTASSTTETYKVFKLDSNDTLTEVTD